MLYLYTKEELRFRQPAQKFWEVLIEGNQSEIFFFVGDSTFVRSGNVEF